MYHPTQTQQIEAFEQTIGTIVEMLRTSPTLTAIYQEMLTGYDLQEYIATL